MRGETEEMRKKRWKGICGIQFCNVFKMVHVRKFENNILTSDMDDVLIKNIYFTID